MYAVFNMLFECVFYSAERNRLPNCNPSVEISAKGLRLSDAKSLIFRCIVHGGLKIIAPKLILI